MVDLRPDVSSYEAKDTATNPLDLVQKLGGIRQQQNAIQLGDISIERAKMEKAGLALNSMRQAIQGIGPNGTKEQYLAVGANLVKQGVVPADQFNSYKERVLSTNPKQFYVQTMSELLNHGEAINWALGSPGAVDNGQSTTPTLQSNMPGFTRDGSIVKPAGAPIQHQLPVSTEGVDDRRTLPDGSPNPAFGQKRLSGAQAPQLPVGASPVPGGLPGQYTNSTAPAMPVADKNAIAAKGNPKAFEHKNGYKPAVAAPAAPVAPTQPPNFNDRFAAAFPQGPATSLAPGAASAMETTAAGGAGSLVQARAAGANYQREIFPLMQAIPALEKLGTKGTGPGTDTINHLKSFALSNIPGVKESDFNGTVADYDKAKKYLTDFVNQTGNSGTNDKLAAAFAGNPSVGISNAAAVDVAKSALALRRMKQAELVAFEKSGLPAEQHQAFAARFNNDIDPRAFGIDLYGKDKLKKLLSGMTPEEQTTFKHSLEIANQSKTLPAIGGK